MLRKLMNEKEVEAEYHLSKSWLRKRRPFRDGPPFLRISRMVLYKREELEKWLESHRVVTK